MIEISFKRYCTASYYTSLEAPDDLFITDENGELTEEAQEKIIEYIEENMNDGEMESALEWINDEDDFSPYIRVYSEKGKKVFYKDI